MGSNQKLWLECFGKIGAIVTGHFVLKSGKHSDTYVNKDGIYPYVGYIHNLCLDIARQFADLNVQVVAAPALGGIALSQWTSYHLAKRSQVAVEAPFAIYAEKSENGLLFEFRRGYDKFIDGKRVLIVEDILTTGGSVQLVIDETRRRGGEVVGVGAICNRGGVTAEKLGIPMLYAVTNIHDVQTWEEDDCPLCHAGAPIPINTDLGHGRAYLERKAAEAERHGRPPMPR